MGINDLTKEGWVKLYIDEGKTLTQLADKFGVNPTTIMNRLKKFGIKRSACGNKRRIICSKEDIEKAYVFDNLSITAIGKLFGITYKSVLWHMKEYGIARRKRPKELFTKEFLLELLDSGAGPYKIAEDTGFSVPVVYKYLYKYDLIEDTHKQSRRFSVEGEDAICSMYQNGCTIVDIAKKYSCYTKAVNDVLVRKGVIIRESNSYVKKVPDIDVAVKLYFDGGLSLSDIANKCGCTKNAVYQLFKRNGVKCRSRSDAVSGKNNPIFGVGHNDESKEKMVKAYSMEVRRPFVGNNFVSSLEGTPLQGEVVVRSSWEAAVIRYFNSRSTLFMYEPRTFLLDIDGKKSSYLPDFYLPKEEMYIEVKGWEKEGGIKKFEAFVELGYKAELWNKDKLVLLGILDKSFNVIV